MTGAASTTRIYSRIEREFLDWCETSGADPNSLEAARRYLDDVIETGAAWGTVIAKRSAITRMHLAQGNSLPPTRDQGLLDHMASLRQKYRHPAKPKLRLTPQQVATLLTECDDSLRGLRNRAIIAVIWHTKLNRQRISELACNHLRAEISGLSLPRWDEAVKEFTVRLPGTEPIEVLDTWPGFPATALRSWVKAANIKEGAIFRAMDYDGGVRPLRLSATSIRNEVARCCGIAGLSPRLFSAESLRG